jgi:hypothetical protein
LQTTDATTGNIYAAFYDSVAARKGYVGFGGSGDDNFSIWNDENSATIFSTNATERARIPSTGGIQSKTTISVGDATPSTSGAGITFPATQSASTDANTLDDYEEGTWTPAGVLTTAGTSASSDVVGTYTKVGRLVTVATNFTFTKGTGTGNFSVSGLPFTVGSAQTYTAVALQCERVGAALNVVGAYVNPSTTNLNFLLMPQGTTATALLTDTALGTTAAIRFSVTYFV